MRENLNLNMDRPILFSAPMVRAILDHRKTQTRRVVKPQPFCPRSKLCLTDPIRGIYYISAAYLNSHDYPDGFARQYTCPYGMPGDKLWVKETWCQYKGMVYYRADDALPDDWKWKPSIFMPKILSRITLEITGIRVERLQNISENDAQLEGVDGIDADGFDLSAPAKTHWIGSKNRYQNLWELINGKKYPWVSNPWVWVIEFKRI